MANHLSRTISALNASSACNTWPSHPGNFNAHEKTEVLHRSMSNRKESHSQGKNHTLSAKRFLRNCAWPASKKLSQFPSQKTIEAPISGKLLKLYPCLSQHQISGKPPKLYPCLSQHQNTKPPLGRRVGGRESTKCTEQVCSVRNPQISFLSPIKRIWDEMNPLSLSSETYTPCCNEIVQFPMFLQTYLFH